MIPRILSSRTKQMASWFPVVSVTGPRQSGKSTMVRNVFADYQYVNLEEPQTKQLALDDPVGFIKNRPSHLIIDEAQYAPDLFSMIQVVSDDSNTTGQYVLSGSQNFLLTRKINQSLAGRVGIISLLPLSYREALEADSALSADNFMLQGGFPRTYMNHIPPKVFFSAYLKTYVERDIAGYLDVRNLGDFRRFLEICADSAGNLINTTEIASTVGANAKTVKAWMGMLESSYVTFQLRPFFTNTRKRVTRVPKFYFHDTGLLCHLLNIRTIEELLTHPKLGAVFENLIVAETLKRHINDGDEPELYFYRDENKVEVDLLDFTNRNHPELIEIKSGQTYHDRFASHLRLIGDTLGIPNEQRWVVARVSDSYTSRGINVSSAADWLRR